MVQLIIDYRKLAMRNLMHVLFHSDTALLRLVLSIGSLVWSLMWMYEFCCPNDAFMAAKYTSYILLLAVFPPLVWATLFMIHFAASMFGVLIKSNHKLLILLDSILGATLWSGTTSLVVFVYVSRQEIPPAMITSNICLTVFALLLIIRTPYGRHNNR